LSRKLLIGAAALVLLALAGIGTLRVPVLHATEGVVLEHRCHSQHADK